MGVSKGLAAFQVQRATAEAARALIQASALDRLLHWLKRLIAPFFAYRKFEFFECEDVRRLPTFQAHPAIQVTTYDGSITIPRDIAELSAPSPGETMTAIYVARRVAGHMRAGFKDTFSKESGAMVKLNGGEVYLYDITILPEYRGMGLTKYMLVSAIRTLNEKGFGRVVVGDVSDGRLQGADLERLGFQKFQTIKSYKIFGKRINVLSE